jgi:hypothetical protein
MLTTSCTRSPRTPVCQRVTWSVAGLKRTIAAGETPGGRLAILRGGPARENRECHRPAAPGLHGRAQAAGKRKLAAGDRAAYYAGFRDAMEACSPASMPATLVATEFASSATSCSQSRTSADVLPALASRISDGHRAAAKVQSLFLRLGDLGQRDVCARGVAAVAVVAGDDGVSPGGREACRARRLLRVARSAQCA